jgi:hypothetical protein
VEEEEGTVVEEEEEPRTPLQSTLKEGEYKKNTNKKCCGSNKHVIVEL